MLSVLATMLCKFLLMITMLLNIRSFKANIMFSYYWIVNLAISNFSTKLSKAAQKKKEVIGK